MPTFKCIMCDKTTQAAKFDYLPGWGHGEPGPTGPTYWCKDCLDGYFHYIIMHGLAVVTGGPYVILL